MEGWDHEFKFIHDKFGIPIRHPRQKVGVSIWSSEGKLGLRI